MKLTATKRVPFFILLVVITAIPCWYLNFIYGYLAFSFLLFAGLFSCIYMLILKKNFECSVEISPESCYRGGTVNFSIKIKKTIRLSMSTGSVFFFIENDGGGDRSEVSSVFSLGKENEQTFDFSVDFVHAGIYRTGISKLWIRDLLGLFRLERLPDNSEHPVTVLPKEVELGEFSLSERNFVETPQAVLSSPRDGSDYNGVREYSAGDPIKQIHWKLSAHMRGYVTKIMETHTNTGVAVIMDMSVPNIDIEEGLCIRDCIVESGMAVMKYAASSGIDCDYLMCDAEKETRYATAYTSALEGEILSFLIRPDQGGSFRMGMHLLEQMEMMPYGHHNVVFCTGYVTDEIIQKLLKMKKGGKHPILVYAFSPELYHTDEAVSRIVRMAEDAGIVCYSGKDASQLVRGGV